MCIIFTPLLQHFPQLSSGLQVSLLQRANSLKLGTAVYPSFTLGKQELFSTHLHLLPARTLLRGISDIGQAQLLSVKDHLTFYNKSQRESMPTGAVQRIRLPPDQGPSAPLCGYSSDFPHEYMCPHWCVYIHIGHVCSEIVRKRGFLLTVGITNYLSKSQ